jgi:hypothetical protein
MLTRIQLKASGKTAHEVEAHMRVAIDAIKQALDLKGSITDQFIEGTPGQSFNGRLVFAIDIQDQIMENVVMGNAASGVNAMARTGTNG